MQTPILKRIFKGLAGWRRKGEKKIIYKILFTEPNRIVLVGFCLILFRLNPLKQNPRLRQLESPCDALRFPGFLKPQPTDHPIRGEGEERPQQHREIPDELDAVEKCFGATVRRLSACHPWLSRVEIPVPKACKLHQGVERVFDAPFLDLFARKWKNGFDLAPNLRVDGRIRHLAFAVFL